MVKFLRFLNDSLEEYIASALFVAFSSLMMLNVIMRYCFQSALPWAEELVLFIFIWFVWFAVPLATKAGTHARVTLIQDLLPKKVKAILNILLTLLTVVLFVLITIAAIRYLGHSAVRGKTGLLINYPMWLFYLPAPIGITLTVYRLIISVMGEISVLFNPREKVEG